MFRPGMPVRCINGDWTHSDAFGPLPPDCPKVGTCYTVARVVPAIPDFPDEYLVLHEINRDTDGRIFVWAADHFSPITDRDTDIAIFKKLLEPKPLRVVELPDIGP